MLQIDIFGRTVAPGLGGDDRSADTMMHEARGRLVALAAMGINGSHRGFVATWARPDSNGVLTIVCGMMTAPSNEGRATGMRGVGASRTAHFGSADLMHESAGPRFGTDGAAFGGVFQRDTEFGGFDMHDGAEGMSILPASKPAPGRGGVAIERIVGVDGVVAAPLPTGIALGAAGLAAMAGWSSLARWRR
jgi:hypothetical protein